VRLEAGRVLKTLLLTTCVRIVCTRGTEVHSNPWYADIMNYLVIDKLPEGWNNHDRDRLLHLVKFYI